MSMTVTRSPGDELEIHDRVIITLRKLVKSSDEWTYESLAAAMKERGAPKMSAQTLSLHLAGKNGGPGFAEVSTLCELLGVTLSEVAQYAEQGEGFPLRAKRELSVIQGGRRSSERIEPVRRPLLRAVDPGE
jgi:hypothetical protein